MITEIVKNTTKITASAGILYLLAIMPRMLNRPDTTLFKKVYFAHRGLHDNATDAPENSMEAFRKAVDAGFGIELDVHVTADGVPVIFHDFNLERICGAAGVIEEYTYEELQQFSLCSSKEKIPRLADLLAMVDGRVPLIVEIKSESVHVGSCAIVDKMLRAYRGAYCIESFNPLVLLWFRIYHNDVVRGQLSSNFRKEGVYKSILYFLIGHLLLNFLTKPDFIAYNHKFNKEPGRRICHYIYRRPAAAWTVKNERDLESARGEFDVFIFDSFCPVKTD